jgi:hypothetical protein
VMNPDGRLWTLPNVLAGLGLPSQGQTIEVTAP